MYKIRQLQAFFLIPFLAFLTVSCGKLAPGNNIREGYVEYEISYMENQTDNILTEHMPDKLTMKFKNNSSVNEIEGFFGFFALNNISDHREATNTTMLKILDKKYFYLGTPDEKPCCFDAMEGMKINFTEETREICGLECKKALITFPGKETPPFSVYYTNEINIHDPNRTNPFREIDGVLMEFEIKLRNLRMRLQAFNVVEKNMGDKDFSIPSGYQRISKNDMEEIVEKLLN